MLKFDKFNDDLNTPFDTGILNGLSDPVLIVNENYSIVHYNRAFKRILEADPLSTKRPTYVFSRDALLGKVWGGNVYVEARTVDVHIRRLRKALDVNDGPNLVRTVRSAGYSLDITPNIMP